MIKRDFLIATSAITTWSKDGQFCTHCLKSACLVLILTMTLFKLLKCTVAKPPICCSCFCNEQLNKNVKCGKEYFILNVSNIVLVIFKSFITFCWEKKRIQNKIAY